MLFSLMMIPLTQENGPDGIRTGICDLDRVPCSPYTTGPMPVSGSPRNLTRQVVTKIWLVSQNGNSNLAPH